jgi:hypothetical protein
MIGEVSLIWRSEVARQGELGYIFHPDFHGHGYATEAGRELMKLGHDVKLIAPQYVRPFVKRQKNDVADTGHLAGGHPADDAGQVPQVVEQARNAVDEGWRFLRFGAGMEDEDWTGGDGSIYEPLESLELAAHWIREVRNEVGPGIGLSIDFHHRLNVTEAALFCQKIELKITGSGNLGEPASRTATDTLADATITRPSARIAAAACRPMSCVR